MPALAIELHMAAGLLDEAVDHAEAESAAGAGPLGGVEGLEGTLAHLRRHARARVRHPQGDIVPRYGIGEGRGVALVDLRPGRLDDEPPSRRHGVARIDGQIQQRVLDLPGIGHDQGQLARQARRDLDRRAQAAAQQLDHAGHKGVEVHRPGIERLPPPEGEQPLGQLGAELGGLLGLLENLALLLIPEPPLEHLEIAGDHREKIVEIMGDAPGELADRLHLLGLAQLLFHLHPCREVPDEACRWERRVLTSPTASSMGKIVPSLR